MSIIGYAAAALNVFLDIPIVLRAVTQSVYFRNGPHMQIGNELLLLIQQDVPNDPTGIFDVYCHDWWNHEKDGEKYPKKVNLEEAFLWHLDKVSEKFAFALC